jgi:hypothetical protein
MPDIFKTLTAGFSRFIMAFIVPSVATLAVFVIFVYPDVAGSPVLAPIAALAGNGRIEAALLFATAALLYSLVFALGSVPLYRFLEGYTLPRTLRHAWQRKQIRAWIRLTKTYNHTRERSRRLVLKEKLRDYPHDRADIMPTRLGNAFRSIETYGRDQFGLDSQAFHYELTAVVQDHVRRDYEDTRAQVDFFLAFTGQLCLLGLVSLFAAVSAGSGGSLAVAVTSMLLARAAYLAALGNMEDLRYATQALVNVGRPALASALGYRLPSTIADERLFWKAWSRAVRTREFAILATHDRDRLEASETAGSAAMQRWRTTSVPSWRTYPPPAGLSPRRQR